MEETVTCSFLIVMTSRKQMISIKLRKNKAISIFPVASETKPMAYGPINPPKLPIELMRAIPTAASNSVRNKEGIAQKGPKILYIPSVAKVIIIMDKIGLVVKAHPIIPIAPTSGGRAVCIFLSPVRSERRPHQTMAIPPIIYGIMVIKPTCVLLTVVDKDLIMVGIQNPIPYKPVTSVR